MSVCTVISQASADWCRDSCLKCVSLCVCTFTSNWTFCSVMRVKPALWAECHFNSSSSSSQLLTRAFFCAYIRQFGGKKMGLTAAPVGYDVLLCVESAASLQWHCRGLTDVWGKPGSGLWLNLESLICPRGPLPDCSAVQSAALALQELRTNMWIFWTWSCRHYATRQEEPNTASAQIQSFELK